MSSVEQLKADLEDAEVELEELMECGDLEEQLNAAFKVATLQKVLLAKANLEEPKA